MFVSETYSLQDCKYYCDWSKLTSTWTKDTSVSGRLIYIAPYTWSEAVDMEFKFQSIPSTTFIGLKVANSLGMKFALGRISGQWRVDYNTNQSQNISPSITTDSVILLKSTALNSQTLYVDDSSILSKSTSNNSQGLRCDVFNNDAFELEYVKVL